MKTRICILFIIVLITTACSSVVNMTSEKMNKLELGMSKQQVTEILGSNYTIAEKKIEMEYKWRYYPTETFTRTMNSICSFLRIIH